MKFQLVTLISVLLAKQECVKDKFCVSATKKDKTIEFTVHSSEAGWAAIGLGLLALIQVQDQSDAGKEMKNSIIVAGWQNSTKGSTIVTLFAPSQVLPAVNPGQIATPIALQVPLPSWAKLGYSFTVPVVSSSATIKDTQDYIWAMGSEKPSNPDSQSSTFKQHSEKGVFGASQLTQSGATQTIARLSSLLALSFLIC